MFMRSIVVLLLSTTLFACHTPVRQHSDLPEVPTTFSLTPGEMAVPPTQRWWQDFNDPRLNQLQEQLFSANLNLRQALYRLEQLEARQRSSAAGLLPTLNLNANVRREQTVGSAGETQTTAGRIAVAAAYEIDLWQRLKHRATAADLRLLAGEDEVRTLLLSLSATLTEQYFFAIEQQAQITLLQQRYQRNADLVRLIAERYHAGLSTASEYFQAQQNLALMESQIPQFQTALVQAENAIALLLGAAPGAVRIAEHQLPQVRDAVAIGLPADLLHQRPDITAALLELAAADYELAAALADRLPRLDLTANIGRSFSRLSGGDVSGTVWSLALGLAQPLYDGGRLTAISDQQRALREEKLAASQQVILTAIEEVESALQSEQNSARRSVSLDQLQQINQKNLQLRQENYLRGLSDSLELLRSELAQLEIRSQQLTNQRQWLSHRISLVRALGGHWMNDELLQQRQRLAEERQPEAEPPL